MTNMTLPKLRRAARLGLPTVGQWKVTGSVLRLENCRRTWKHLGINPGSALDGWCVVAKTGRGDERLDDYLHTLMLRQGMIGQRFPTRRDAHEAAAMLLIAEPGLREDQLFGKAGGRHVATTR